MKQLFIIVFVMYSLLTSAASAQTVEQQAAADEAQTILYMWMSDTLIGLTEAYYLRIESEGVLLGCAKMGLHHTAESNPLLNFQLKEGAKLKEASMPLRNLSVFCTEDFSNQPNLPMISISGERLNTQGYTALGNSAPASGSFMAYTDLNRVRKYLFYGENPYGMCLTGEIGLLNPNTAVAWMEFCSSPPSTFLLFDLDKVYSSIAFASIHIVE